MLRSPIETPNPKPKGCTTERKGFAQKEEGLTSQFDRERHALVEEVLEAKLELARIQITTDQLARAEALLTTLLNSPRWKAQAGMIHALRAEARRKLGNDQGAQEDRLAAEKLGTKATPLDQDTRD